MAWYDRLPLRIQLGRSQQKAAPPVGSYAATDPSAGKAWSDLNSFISRSGGSPAARMVKAVLEKRPSVSPAATVGITDLGFKGARQQLFQRFNLVDLYGIAYNNSTVKTAIMSLKQEVFRRGLQWEPAFAYRCESCGVDYSDQDAKAGNLACSKCEGAKDEQGKLKVDPTTGETIRATLYEPDLAQRVRFESIMQKANMYGQSLLGVLKTGEDDLNVADDIFLMLSAEYTLEWEQSPEGMREHISKKVKQIFRLDPVFVEFDTDEENRPGFAHHLCLLHRDNLLDIPRDSGWEYEWKGRCPIDGHKTFPVIYRYSPYRGTYGAQKGNLGPSNKTIFLTAGEVIHASKFSPSELYGYSPLLSIYEKALSLIGMDRYLYDYFFERQIPQGVVTTVTDNPDDLETRKEQVLANTLNNPHYIPWLAISSKTGQGKTEFVRFAYSLDEMDFLPTQEALERSIAGVYGVPGLFMGFEQSYGGLASQGQEVVRMSRGAQLSQDVYNVEVLPALLKAFGITDWKLTLAPAEEESELVLIETKQAKATWAATMVNMGFGVEYDQESDEYQINGSVKPMAEQQMEQAMMGGMGGGEDPGGGDEGDGSHPKWESGTGKGGQFAPKDQKNQDVEKSRAKTRTRRG